MSLTEEKATSKQSRKTNKNSVTARLKTNRRHTFSAQNFLAAGVVIVGLAVWWVAGERTSGLAIAEPVEVARRTGALIFGPESAHTWTSMARIVVAVIAALVIGSLLVFLARLVPVTEAAVTRVLLPFLNSVPALGWAILGVIWFGVGNSAVIIVVTLILLPFCMVNMWEGLRSLDPEIQEMGRSFTRSKTRVLIKIQLPLLMPYILAAVRLSFSVGWKVALIAEFFGARSGLGLLMNRARQSFDTPTVFAAIIVVLIIVTLVERLIFEPLSTRAAKRSGTLASMRGGG